MLKRGSFQAMMAPVADKIDNAINHPNEKKMTAALAAAVQTCNACHTATASPFIKVALGATESLSMRHPPKFTSQKMGKHMH